MNSTQKCAYHAYLQLPKLLDLQFPLAEPVHHDEMLFIIVHQCHELWFKQVIHEIFRLREKLELDEIFEALKSLKRIHEIFKLVSYHMDILNTLSPDEFAGYRHVLSPASGFQSYQFRIIEFLCGIKVESYLEGFKDHLEIYSLMQECFLSPSLFDKILLILRKRNLLSSDPSQSEKNEVLEAILQVYKNRENFSDLHFLFENFVDLDSTVQIWRTQHVKIAERMIGRKMGTGGSSGVDYLANVASKKLFPILWEVRSLI